MKKIAKFILVFSMTALTWGAAIGAEMAEKSNMAMNDTGKERNVGPRFKPSAKRVTAARGETVFVEHCANCHGIQGKGDGPRSAFFDPGAQYFPDLTVAEYLKGRDKELLVSIRDGLARLPEPAVIMPQFKYILSEDEIRSVLAYIKTLPGKQGKR